MQLDANEVIDEMARRIGQLERDLICQQLMVARLSAQLAGLRAKGEDA